MNTLTQTHTTAARKRRDSKPLMRGRHGTQETAEVRGTCSNAMQAHTIEVGENAANHSIEGDMQQTTAVRQPCSKPLK